MTRVLAARLHPSAPALPEDARRAPDLELPPQPAEAAPLGRALAWAKREGGDWLWVLGGGLQAGPGTLEALLAGGAGAKQPPAMVASLVLAPDGLPRAADLPRSAQWGAEAVHEAVRRRTVSILFAPGTSLLVRVSDAGQIAPPRERELGALAAQEWTARLIGRAPGLLAPRSIVRRVARPPQAPARETLRGALTLRRAGAYSRGDVAAALVAYTRSV